ncbi:WGR domain-containing protein [Mesorhizobium sp. CO1-1-8]|nr:WGR domain-containing protein [Mesorhizobium sp. CO1-1-8]
MNALHYQLYIERLDPGRNMSRFYALSIEETLFGQTCLIRRWGRIGTRGRTVQHSFDNDHEAVGLFLELLRAKRLRGYGPRRPLDTQKRPRPGGTRPLRVINPG